MNHLLAVDIAFTILHTGVILVILFGWAWQPTRTIQAALLVLTAISWFGGGYWYGWGYCLLTDWHWGILALRGVTDLPPSYLQLLVARMTGIQLSQHIADAAALLGLLLGVAGAVAAEVAKRRRRS